MLSDAVFSVPSLMVEYRDYYHECQMMNFTKRAISMA